MNIHKFLLAALLVLAAGCSQSGDNNASAAKGPGGPAPGMPVEAEAVTVGPLSHEIIAVGSLRSDESVTVAPEIAGRITRVGFKEGQPVKAGQLLFQLDDSVYAAQLEQARANLALSQRNKERADELAAKKLISLQDRDTTAAKLEVDQANLKLAGAQIAKTCIAAPFAGVAGLRLVSPGDYVSAGEALVNLEALANLKVDFRLTESMLPYVAVGQKLNLDVDAYPGEKFTGEVYAIDPRVADATRSIGVRARLPNEHGRLRPGLFARVRLEIANKANAITVPEQAVFPNGDKLFVYAIEDGKAAVREVKLGMRLPGKAEITSGLKPGDIVITAGLQKIGPGAPVMAINLQKPAADQTPQEKPAVTGG